MKFSIWRTKLLGALVSVSGLTSEAGGDPAAAGWGEGAGINQNILGRTHIPDFFPTISLSPSPIAVAVRGGWLSEGAISLVGCTLGVLALKIHASHGEASTTVPMVHLVTTSITKKPKTCLLLSNIYLQKLWELLFQLG